VNKIKAHSRKINLHSRFEGEIRTHHKEGSTVNYYSVYEKTSNSADYADCESVI